MHSIQTFKLSPTTTSVSFSFTEGYLDRGHVSLSVQRVGETSYTPVDPSEYSFTTDFTIRLHNRYPDGTMLRVQRHTPAASLVDFVRRSRITAENLTIANRQAIYRTGELEDMLDVVNRYATSSLSIASNALSVSQIASNDASSALAVSRTSDAKATEALEKADDAIRTVGDIAAGAVVSFNDRVGRVEPQEGDYTKEMVGLGNVDNTADLDKPISTAVQTELSALDTKISSIPIASTEIAGITKLIDATEAPSDIFKSAAAVTGEALPKIIRQHMVADQVDLRSAEGLVDAMYLRFAADAFNALPEFTDEPTLVTSSKILLNIATTADITAGTAGKLVDSAVLLAYLDEKLKNALNKVGDIDISAHPVGELKEGWYHANGDRFSVASPQGRALRSLSPLYKQYWGIVEEGGMINLPNLYNTDGRAFYPRFGAAPGVVRDHAMLNITGYTGDTRGPQPTGEATYVSGNYLVGGVGNVPLKNTYLDTSLQHPTDKEVRVLERSFVPVAFLGVKA